jgi:hypothetical protein
MEKFSILVNGEVLYRSPKDYGDDTAEGEAPMSLSAFVAAQLKLPPSERRPGLSFLASLKPGESDTRNGVMITRAGGDVCRVVDVTFDTVSEESVQEGDTDRRGWKRSIVIRREDLDDEGDVTQAWIDATVRAICDEHPGSLEADSSHGVPRWLGETDAQIDEERRDFHFEGGGFTDEEIVTVARTLGVYGFRERRPHVRDGVDHG